MKKLFALIFSLALVLAACGNAADKASEAGDAASNAASEAAQGVSEAANDVSKAIEESATGGEAKAPDKIDPEVTLKVGATAVPHAEILNAVKGNLKARGVNLEVVVFDDYVTPNNALASGDVDANFFQHLPYFEDFTKQNNLKLTSIGTVHIEPIAAFSDQVKSLDALPDGANVLIPNDVTNGARALLLLQANNIIKLDDPTNINVTEANITENPKNLKFTPMEAALLGKSYKDGDLAIINSNYALEAGLNPVKDSIAIEASDSPYANIVAVRTGEENEAKFKVLLEELNSDTVKKYIEDTYKGAVIPAFTK